MDKEEKPKTIRWRKPSGVEIETNALLPTIRYCKSIGWEELPVSGEISQSGDEAKPSKSRFKRK